MRINRLRSVVAAMCVASMFSATVLCTHTMASPAGMSFSGASSSKSAAPAGASTHWWKFWRTSQNTPNLGIPQQPAPSAPLSPLRHPIKYVTAKVHSETPHQTVTKVPQRPDSISLNTPTGPATPQLYVSMGQAAEQQGQIPQARQTFQKAVTMWPNDVEVLRAAARMEDRQGNLAVAGSLYQRAVVANPQHSGALNDLGLCLARQGKLDQSVQVFEQAIHIQPDKALYRNNAATVLVEMRQDQKALAHLAAVHGQAEANFNMGQLLVQRGRGPDAVGYYQAALELNPSLDSARTAIAQINGTTAPSIVTQPATRPPVAAGAPYDQQYGPQQPVAAPNFPETARGPALGTSSYVPPTSYAPTMGGSISAGGTAYSSATAPRYLPPTQSTR